MAGERSTGQQRSTRQRRANGEASRERILDATVEIAGERGYEGTSIKLVSQRAGLPASSIYWHFSDKDALIAAVIERSFTTWLDAMTLPDSSEDPVSPGAKPEATLDPALDPGLDPGRAQALALAAQIGKALLETPDFLRLGLMLALERRPTELSARTMFLQVRHVAHERLVEAAAALAPDLDDATLEHLARYALAGADGIFIAHEIGGDDVDMLALFATHAHALADAVRRARSQQ